MKERSGSKSTAPVNFKANHPFVFVILDKDTGVICFMGLFGNPTEILEVVNEKDLSRDQIQELLLESDNSPNSSDMGCPSSSTG